MLQSLPAAIVAGFTSHLNPNFGDVHSVSNIGIGPALPLDDAAHNEKTAVSSSDTGGGQNKKLCPLYELDISSLLVCIPS